MSVRILENFWDNFRNNEALIRRCFSHHFSRHPDCGGVDESFNNLIVCLHEMRVFEKFDLKRLLIAAGKEGLVDMDNVTEEALKNVGINVDKKWEQFIYKYIEKILNMQYNRTAKLIKRTAHGDTLADYGLPVESVTSWISTAEEATDYEEKYTKYSEEDRRGRVYAPSFSGRYIAGEEGFDNQLDATSVSDLKNRISSELHTDLDHTVFQLLTVEGLSEKEIAIKTETSQQNVNRILLKIKKITRKLCQA